MPAHTAHVPRVLSVLAVAAAVAITAGAAVTVVDGNDRFSPVVSADYPDMNNYEPPADTHYVPHR